MIPHKIRIDASSICQLKCPACPTGTSKLASSAVGSGVLTLHRLCQILDGATWVKVIELSNWGEVFLNKQLVEILEYINAQGIQVTMSNGVNLNNVKAEVLEAVVKYQVRHITCSIDGVTQETYVKYRRGGNINTVLRNIQQIQDYKNKYHSSYPKLTWQFVVFGHNEHELSQAKKLAQEFGMEFRAKLSWDESFSPISDPELVKSETDCEFTSRTEYTQTNGQHYSRAACLQLWNEPQINFDGKVLGCCVNVWNGFGNACENDLLQSINSPSISYARRMLMGHAQPRSDLPCINCDRYQQILHSSNWITSEEVALSAKRLEDKFNSY